MSSWCVGGGESVLDETTRFTRDIFSRRNGLGCGFFFYLHRVLVYTNELEMHTNIVYIRRIYTLGGKKKQQHIQASQSIHIPVYKAYYNIHISFEHRRRRGGINSSSFLCTNEYPMILVLSSACLTTQLSLGSPGAGVFFFHSAILFLSIE